MSSVTEFCGVDICSSRSFATLWQDESLVGFKLVSIAFAHVEVDSLQILFACHLLQLARCELINSFRAHQISSNLQEQSFDADSLEHISSLPLKPNFLSNQALSTFTTLMLQLQISPRQTIYFELEQSTKSKAPALFWALG